MKINPQNNLQLKTAKEFKSIRNLIDKELIQERIFLVKDKNYSIGKNGKAFISLLIGDHSGHIDGRIWDNVQEVNLLFEIGDLVKIKGVVQVYNQKKQIIIHKIENSNHLHLDKNQFVMETSVKDSKNLWAELHTFIQKIESAYIKQLCLDAFSDDEIKKLFLNAPAAKSIHHADRSGLIEHIVSICKLMDFISDHYKNLNKDLLLFGAIFHDFGKIWELEINSQGQITYSTTGQLLGHIYLACEFVEKKSQKILGFPDDLRMILKHIILGHHGKVEYGSPKKPQFPEAFIVALIDDLDSKIDQVMGFVLSERLSGDSWSRYHENLDRYFYLEDLKGKWI